MLHKTYVIKHLLQKALYPCHPPLMSLLLMIGCILFWHVYSLVCGKCIHSREGSVSSVSRNFLLKYRDEILQLSLCLSAYIQWKEELKY